VGERRAGLLVLVGMNQEGWTKEEVDCQSLLEGMGSVQQKKGWSINLYWKEYGAMDKIRTGLSDFTPNHGVGLPIFAGRSRE
jgi:hypothetical protein